MKLKILEEKDIQQIIDIYSYYVKNTTITFEYTIPSYEEFKKRFLDIQKNYPFIVCEYKNKICGYTYATMYHKRAAYSWDCELSIYVDNKFWGKNIGTNLYSAIIDILTLQGYYNAYARITMPNLNSFNIHKKLGFSIEGVNKKTGFKNGKWIDVSILSKQLRQYTIPEDFPLSINNIDKSKIDYILKKYSK